MRCGYSAWRRSPRVCRFLRHCSAALLVLGLRDGLRWLRSECVSLVLQRCRSSWPPVAPFCIGRWSGLAAERCRAIFRNVMGRVAARLLNWCLLALLFLVAGSAFAVPTD